MIAFRSAPSRLAALCFISLLGAASAPTAQAGCQLIDCLENVDIKASDLKSHSCEQLYILRNSVFNEQGYCFRTDKGSRFFNNANCRHDDIRLVPINDYQRSNIEVIRAQERQRGCTGAD